MAIEITSTSDRVKIDINGVISAADRAIFRYEQNELDSDFITIFFGEVVLVQADQSEFTLPAASPPHTNVTELMDDLDALLFEAGGSGGSATAANQTTMINELQDIEADVEAIDLKLTTTNSELADVNTELDGIKTDTGNIAGDTSTIATDTSVIAGDTSTIAGDTTAIAGDTGNIVTNTGSIDTRLITTNTELADVNTELDDIKTDTGNIANDTSTIAGDTTSIDNKLTTTNSELADVNTELDGIKTDTGNIATDTSTIAGDTTAIAGDTSNIATNTGNIDTRLITTNTELGDVNTELDNISTILTDGSLVSFDYNTSVLLGDVAGAEMVYVYGFRANVQNTFEFVVNNSNGLYFPSTAVTVTVVSDSANDTNSGGTGARSLTIEGVDASYNTVTETLNLNGTSTVTTSNQYFRLNKVEVATSGSSNVNKGEILLYDTNTNQIMGVIEDEEVATNAFTYTVPTGKVFIVNSLSIQGGNNNRPVTVLVYDVDESTSQRHLVLKYLSRDSNNSVIEEPARYKVDAGHTLTAVARCQTNRDITLLVTGYIQDV